MEWKTIDSAPKDGTLIVGFEDIGRTGCEEPTYHLLKWRDYEKLYDEDGAFSHHDQEGWIDCMLFIIHPTHWMPIPDAP